ncbi:sensory transduction protein kinase [Lachnospiraceae bacterium KM106-2]|nr:sensory transduction protein kinase [Lachnospiraceae bacterium KM106-2]
MALVNRKVRYIQYISEQVKKIELEGFGQTIEVRGNDELTDLSKGINLMSVKLREKIEQEKKIEQTKNELITNVSHDLRTPLTSIMGYVTLLQQNGIEDKDKFEEYISVVDRRLKGLNGMINELFEYTKMTSNEYQLNLSKIDLIVILNHLIQEYEIVFEKTGLIIEKHISLEQAYLMADAQKLIRVIQNLFDNARKYAAKGSKVIIRVYEQEDTFRFEIENQTDRTDLGDVNQIFERFYKGDRSRSEAESSGLGLSIVKRIVELHEGEITVRFKENRICFQLSLPLQNDE